MHFGALETVFISVQQEHREKIKIHQESKSKTEIHYWWPKFLIIDPLFLLNTMVQYMLDHTC